MEARSSLHNMADFARLEGKRRVLELLLHVASTKEAEIATLSSTAAVRLGHGQITKASLAGADALLVAQKNLFSLLLRTCDPRLSPARWAPALAMLHKQMCCPNFLIAVAAHDLDSVRVVGCHVDFELLRVGSFWWFPSRFFAVGVEVVRKILRVRHAHFPWLWET